LFNNSKIAVPVSSKFHEQSLFVAIQRKLILEKSYWELYRTKAIVRYCPTIIYARSRYRDTSAHISKVRKSIKGRDN